jgi:hypothetical protein
MDALKKSMQAKGQTKVEAQCVSGWEGRAEGSWREQQKRAKPAGTRRSVH